LLAHSGYILQKIHAAHDFSRRITGEDLITYVRDYLNRFASGHTLQQVGEDRTVIDVKLPPANAARLEEFLKRRRLTGLTRLATGETRRCHFLNKIQRPNASIEVINQFHPLVRFIAKELDANEDPPLTLICVKVPHTASIPIKLEPGIYAGAVHRWFFEGIRTEEILRARVVVLSSGAVLEPEESLSVINTARLEGRDWLEAANDVDIAAGIQGMDEAEFSLIADFESERQVKEAENADRISFQRDSITKHLDRRLDIERRRISSLLGDARGRGLIVAAERKMKILKERFDIQTANLAQKEKITVRYDLVCKCLLLVE
jgi:hypothetical protein